MRVVVAAKVPVPNQARKLLPAPPQPLLLPASTKRYAAIMIDPPWHFKMWGKGTERSIEHHYPTLNIEEMMKIPMQR